MLCERCQQRQANVQFTEIINNKKKTIRLCDVCAKEMQIDNFAWSPQLNLHNFLAGLLQTDFGTFKTPSIEQKSCKTCGLTEERFIKKGLLGCADCYEDFGHRLEPLLRRIHGNSRHTGKVPERTGGNVRLLNDIERLKGELREVIIREEFERAAELRDQIKELEKKINQGG
ncbi:UvrB/UvrC motif-containing protein [Desulfolucanica intricata]|uniref:UvrB/UvrC motif-containing protein n=1 Tax=Desulfolucanica intricata TaxID=1285191 RepID=UPI00082A3685|nr:UvrB/UvrC motif-containing protein [Desulfolucanica intricata]